MSTKKNKTGLVVDVYLGVKENQPTINGRIYPKDVLLKAAQQYNKEKVRKRVALAHIGDPPLSHTVASVRKVYRQKGQLMAKIEFMDKGCLVCCTGMLARPCGVGDFEKDGKTIAPGYKLVSIGFYPKEQCRK